MNYLNGINTVIFYISIYLQPTGSYLVSSGSTFSEVRSTYLQTQLWTSCILCVGLPPTPAWESAICSHLSSSTCAGMSGRTGGLLISASLFFLRARYVFVVSKCLFKSFSFLGIMKCLITYLFIHSFLLILTKLGGGFRFSFTHKCLLLCSGPWFKSRKTFH